MDRFFSLWDAMEPRRRIVAILAAIATVVVVVSIARLAAQPSMSLLYAGLQPDAAAAVVSSLEQKGIKFEIRGNAVFVPSNERDRARMSLAAESLPANGTQGYELLDSLSGFGTTSEMFDATYWRAKEGELARTIVTAPNLRAARVHIANPVNRPFQRDVKPTASVIVTMSVGQLDTQQAQAVRHLVASAVAGMTPTDVAVIDAEAGIILRAGETETAGTDSASPDDRAATIRAKLERLLEARVGTGKAIVEVTVDTNRESETVTERVIDPESRVAIATDSTESSENAEGLGQNGVTIASNLPDGDPTEANASAKRNATETRERTNYEISEVRRERVKLPGEVRRISVAVLVDGVTTTAADGTTTWAVRSDEEIAVLSELVRSAVGFDEARGDVVTIQSLEFQPAPVAGTVAESGVFDVLALNAMTLIQLAVLAIVAIVLAIFVLRPMLAPPVEEENLIAEDDALALTGPDGEPIEPGSDLASTIEAASEILDPEDPVMIRVATLRDVITEKSEESALILRNWLESPEDTEELA